ncbi:hypothetical protein [Tropicimonas marinistellae]|uniref:hypothetical protein n=1 Tax=Tropicimonas marinistellae TaxID=1739787 RepID=UPI00122DCB84|nr:hypothetical protein [Tropicimonas marinistellae]
MVLSSAGQNLLRILIASYFLAGAIGIIPGTDLTPMFLRFLPMPLAGLASGSLVFLLSYLVMIGVWLRGAALTLGILTFWSSYLRMLDLGIVDELGGFWRDLALIAALMLTYAETDPRNHGKRSPLRRKIAPRTVDPRAVVIPEEDEKQPLTAQRARIADRRREHMREPVSVEELEDIFREEFEIARSN